MKTIEELREEILNAFYRFGADPQCIKGHHKNADKKYPQMMFTLLLRNEGKRRQLTGQLSEIPFIGEFYAGNLRQYHEWMIRDSKIEVNITIPEDDRYQVYAITQRKGTAKQKAERLQRDLATLLEKLEERIPKKRH